MSMQRNKAAGMQRALLPLYASSPPLLSGLCGAGAAAALSAVWRVRPRQAQNARGGGAALPAARKGVRHAQPPQGASTEHTAHRQTAGGRPPCSADALLTPPVTVLELALGGALQLIQPRRTTAEEAEGGEEDDRWSREGGVSAPLVEIATAECSVLQRWKRRPKPEDARDEAQCDLSAQGNAHALYHLDCSCPVRLSLSLAMSSPAPNAQLHAAILQYIQQLQAGGSAAAAENGVKDVEPLEIAAQCLIEATGADVANAPKTASLADLFARGLRSVSAVESNPKWPQFLALLKDKSFFAGAAEGTAEHAKRMEAARAKFESKYAAEAASSSSSAAAASSPAPAEVSAADKSAAESAKNAGNALLAKQDHQGACDKYTEAIKLNPTNAIYYANRAATHINLKRYREAVADCRSSIEIDENYPKSHYRLGQALSALGDYAGCLPPFERALALSSKDEGMAVTIREQIRIAKNKLNPPVAQQNQNQGQGHAGGDDPFASMGGMGGLSSMLAGLTGGGAGGAGGMDFGALLSNPAIANMMSSPQMQQMMQNMDFGAMMKDPNGLGGMMAGMAEGMENAPKETEVDTSYKPPSASALFDDEDVPATAAAPAPKPAAAAKPAASSGAGAGAGAGAKPLPPQLASFLATPAGRAAAEDPELKPVLEDIKSNGIGAAMKYMSNPSIMSKISQLMAPMMGGGAGAGAGAGAGRR